MLFFFFFFGWNCGTIRFTFQRKVWNLFPFVPFILDNKSQPIHVCIHVYVKTKILVLFCKFKAHWIMYPYMYCETMFKSLYCGTQSLTAFSGRVYWFFAKDALQKFIVWVCWDCLTTLNASREGDHYIYDSNRYPTVPKFLVQLLVPTVPYQRFVTCVMQKQNRHFFSYLKLVILSL